MAFSVVKNVKSADFPKRNGKIALARLVREYALHTASSLLKLKSKFHNSKIGVNGERPQWVDLASVRVAFSNE